MACAEPRPGVAMEVFVEEHEVAPVWIALEALDAAEHGTSAVLTEKNGRQAPREFGRDFPERHHAAGTRRALDGEIAAKVVVELLQRFDQQVVDRKPHRSAPVRVAAEERVRRL